MSKSFEFIAEKHALRITTYPFYKCSCGYEATILISPNEIIEKVTKKPIKVIEYLSCGHATCCEIEYDNKKYCSHCGEIV